MLNRKAIRVIGHICRFGGGLALLGSALYFYGFFFDPNTRMKPSTIAIALILAGGGVVLSKAGVAWLAEMENDARKWHEQKERKRQDRARERWLRRDPNAWWILRFPGLRISSSASVELHVPEFLLAEFKRDMLARGYGPEANDPLLDGAAERWLRNRDQPPF